MQRIHQPAQNYNCIYVGLTWEDHRDGNVKHVISIFTFLMMSKGVSTAWDMKEAGQVSAKLKRRNLNMIPNFSNVSVLSEDEGFKMIKS